MRPALDMVIMLVFLKEAVEKVPTSRCPRRMFREVLGAYDEVVAPIQVSPLYRAFARPFGFIVLLGALPGAAWGGRAGVPLQSTALCGCAALFLCGSSSWRSRASVASRPCGLTTL